MKRLLLVSLAVMLSGCAGTAKIWEYDTNKAGELELEKYTEFEGKNIRVKTADGVEMETKNLEFPQLPSFKYEAD